MKRILVLDREFGAGASTIGTMIATRLGWKIFDEALTREIARLANIPVDACRRLEERTDPWLQRLVNIVWRGTFDRNLPAPDLAILDTDRLVALSRQVVEEAAKEGPCVIIGRASPQFLQHRADTLAVFLYSSRDLRYRRVLARAGDPQKAVELVDTVDEHRRKFFKHYFGYEWPNRHLFHAMLDTSLGDRKIMDIIIDLLGTDDRSQHAGSQ